MEIDIMPNPHISGILNNCSLHLLTPSIKNEIKKWADTGGINAFQESVELLVSLHTVVSKSQPLFKLYPETQSQLDYARDFLKQGHEIFQIEVSSSNKLLLFFFYTRTLNRSRP